MVLPDGTKPERRRPTSGRAVVGTMAALALVGGSLTLGALTSPDPALVESADITTSTVEELERPIDLENFAVGQIAMGEPLVWERAAGVDGLYPIQIVVHEGLIYLFGSTHDAWGDQPAPLTVWRSGDGRAWESLGTVLVTERPVNPIVSAAGGMVGVEAGSAGITLWRSDDGLVWENEPIPVEVDSPMSVVYVTAIATDDDRLVLAGQVQFDPTGVIEERLAATGIDVDLDRFGWGQEFIDGEVQLVIYGPLGLHLEELSAQELGMTEEELADVVSGGHIESPARVWTHHDEVGWQQGTVEGTSWIESLRFVGPRLVAFAYADTGATSWVSDDGGLSWERSGGPVGPQSATAWGDGFVAFQHGSLLDVATSLDGFTWERAGLDEHFPYQMGWYGSALAAGEAGIVFAAEGWEYETGPSNDPPPVELFDGEAVLSLDFSGGRIELETGDDTHLWNMYASQPGAGIEFDLVANTVVFLDPETKEALATFAIDDIMDAESSYWPRFGVDERSFQALVSSPNAQNWTIQDVEESFGDDSRIFEMEMVGDTIIALVTSMGNRFLDDPGFEIWTAPAP